ncbi:MFS transporter [Micromonospora sp. LOL_024]|uniref:MFS transporter n=1 Tax=Micromonospora sp. LOL_024 TaxID=3345412 RepID=UPI003A861BEF
MVTAPPSARADSLFASRLRAMTVGSVALVSLLAFEALAVGTAMPTVARALDGLALYGFAFGGPFAAGVVALYVIVARAYPERLHRRIFAAFAAAWVVPSLVGPVVAGLVVEHFGWRWVFLAVPAVAVPAVLLVHPGLGAVHAPGAVGSTAGAGARIGWACGGGGEHRTVAHRGSAARPRRRGVGRDRPGRAACLRRSCC